MAMNASVSLCCSALCENRRASKQRCFVPPIPSCARRADLRFWLLSRRPRARRGAARRGAARASWRLAVSVKTLCVPMTRLAHVCVSLCAGWGPAALGHHTRHGLSAVEAGVSAAVCLMYSHILEYSGTSHAGSRPPVVQATSTTHKPHLSQMAERNLRTSLRSRHTNQIECSLLL